MIGAHQPFQFLETRLDSLDYQQFLGLIFEFASPFKNRIDSGNIDTGRDPLPHQKLGYFAGFLLGAARDKRDQELIYFLIPFPNLASIEATLPDSWFFAPSRSSIVSRV